MKNKIAIGVGGLFCVSGVFGIFEKFTSENKESFMGTFIVGLICIVIGALVIYLGIKRPEVLTKLLKSKKKNEENLYNSIRTNCNYLEKLNIDTSYMKNKQMPTTNQLKYAKSLNITLPKGVTKNDVSCIIAKASGEEAPGLPGTDIVQFALNRKIEFSPYTTKNRFIGAILSSQDKLFNLSFYAYAVYCSLNSVTLGNMDACSVSHLFTEYAETIKNDERITSSIFSRPYSDYYNPNKSTIAFKSAQEFFMQKIN